MHPDTHHDALDQVLRELRDLAAAGPLEPQARDLLARRREGRLRIAVVGEAKRGKSTLVNALLGREVLPSGVVPLTALATALTFGAPERVETLGPGGVPETHPLAALAELVTESGNPRNRRGLSRVSVYLDAPLLAGGIEVIDTPGTGSVHRHNTAAAEAALETVDAAVLVLTADPPVSLAELDLLERVDAASVAMFVLLNKADRLDPDEQAQAEQFTATTIARRLGRRVRIYPCSARRALRTGRDRGLERFIRELHVYLADSRARDLARSLARRAGALAGQLRDHVRLTVQADRLDADVAAGRIEAFRASLDGLTELAIDAGDLARTQTGHLLAGLNQDAADAVETTRSRVLDRLTAWLETDARTLTAAGLERAGDDLVVHAATDAAEAWRREHAAGLGLAVQELANRLAGGFARDQTVVREAAHDLLGLDLGPAPADVTLAGDPRFHYAPPDPQSPTGALATAARTRMPGRSARRRIEHRLAAGVAEACDRQIGRARASLQQRLNETLTALLAQLADRYSRYRDGLEAALAAAEQLRELGAGDAAARRAELAARGARLTGLIERADILARGQDLPLVQAR